MGWNKSGIKDIKINFDLKKLIKRLESNEKFFIPPKIQAKEFKKIAKQIKDNIKNGNFSKKKLIVDWDNMTLSKSTDLEESTKYIRNWRGNPTGPPLIETGNLLNSIRATKTGIEMADYGEHHLKGYKVKANKFTKKWNIKAGTPVPVRNFIHSLDIEISAKDKKEIIKKINNTIKTSNKTLK